MFEMLLTAGNKLYLPWSGPGNKKIVQGNKELGYFGEVSAQEFMLYRSFFSLMAPPRGAQPGFALSDQKWLKFIYKGRILFTPKYRIATSLSWSDIYATGGVYGVRGPGPLPVPPGGAVDQVKILTISEMIDGKFKTWPLKAQLFDGANLNANTTGDYDTDQTEWDNIWTQFFANKWENYDWLAMNTNDSTLSTLVQERTTDGVNAGLRGGRSLGVLAKGAIAATTASGANSWRPVVELLRDDKIAIPVYNVTSAVSNDALTSIIPAFSIDTPKPYLKGIQGLIGVTTYLRDLAPTFDTTTPAVYWEISGAKYSGLATFENDAPLKPVANVSGYRSRLKAPETPITTVIPQVMANTSPVADRRLTTSLTNDAPLVPIIKVSAIRTQLKPADITVTGARPQVMWKTPGTVTLLPPTFEYVEPDDLASAFSNNKLNGFVI